MELPVAAVAKLLPWLFLCLPLLRD